MPTWDSTQYLRFSEERTQPCRDLVARIDLAAPMRIADLGCGPGNSTRVLQSRWPQARVTGVDNSPEMIAAARSADPAGEWILEDATAWSLGNGEFDLIFSNAALQWVPDHAELLPRLLDRTTTGGAVAMQIPCDLQAPAHTIARELARSSGWTREFPAQGVREWHAHDVPFYYDLLAPIASRLDIWRVEYQHRLESVEAIVEWYRGTGLRPYLDALASEELREQFLADYLRGIRLAYPRRADGRVLLPFLRLFLVAYRE